MTVNNLFRNRFYKDTIIMVAAGMVSNFFNYLYQLLMGRFLTPQEYGELFSLLSLFYIFSVFFTTINTSITKFTAVYGVNEEYGKIRSILVKASRGFALLGILMYGSVALSSPLISSFLNIKNSLLILVLFASIPFGLILPAYQGTLRGLQRFGALSVSISSWALFKFLFATGLTMLGYGVMGGVLGVFLAHVLAFIITLAFLRDIFRYEGLGNPNFKDIIKYSGLVFLAIFAYTAIWNIDVILVKHYLSSLEAGNYSAISVLGKIVLFAPGTVGLVVFPKAAEKYEKGESHLHILLRGLALVFLISGCVVLAYALFPKFIITIIYGGKYLSIAPYLWRYGLAMMFLSMIGVVMNYALSINMTQIFYPLFGTLLLEIYVVYLLRISLGGIINGIIVVTGLAFILTALSLWGKIK